MACPSGMRSYLIQAGDNLYNVAAKYNTTYQAILEANPGMNPNSLYIGQQICVPAQATMQLVTQPIIVNGEDINKGQYPVLNYKPANARYPYIYVPIAEFSRVGAQVVWNESQHLLSVTTDYYDIKDLNSSLTNEIINLKKTINTLETENRALQESITPSKPSPEKAESIDAGSDIADGGEGTLTNPVVTKITVTPVTVITVTPITESTITGLPIPGSAIPGSAIPGLDIPGSKTSSKPSSEKGESIDTEPDIANGGEETLTNSVVTKITATPVTVITVVPITGSTITGLPMPGSTP